MRHKKILLACVATLLLAPLLWLVQTFAPVTEYVAVEELDRLGNASDLTDCFWVGNYSDGHGSNFAYPDTGANYWISQFTLPRGAKLELIGEYPHARHMSFNTYDAVGQPVDRLNDTRIAPDSGSTNPYVAQARRDAAQRSYRIAVLAADLKAGADMAQRDAARPENILYVPQVDEAVQLYLRIYVQDQGLTPKAGVELPQPLLTLADGSQLRGESVCQRIITKAHSVRDRHLTRQATQHLLALNNPKTPYHPAYPEPRWTAFLNPPRSFAGVLEGTAFSWIPSMLSQQRKGGFYSTLDNTYMYAYVDNRWGETLVLQGRAPTTPKTYGGTPVMQAGDLRYWSICKYRSLYDTAVDACLNDEQIPVNSKGEYTIVFSTAQMRPDNARPDCGVAWQAWGVGDGIDNPHGGLLVIRHMLPAPEFKQSIFATSSVGSERSTLGPYYPAGAYQAKAAFEARGCPVIGPHKA